jgi:two-component system chemotaxis sensor kinase CheA
VDLDRDLLLQAFSAESEENLAAIEDGLVALEANQADDEALRSIFRNAHTIKGNAATIGFRAVAELGHVFEDVLARLRAHELRLTTTLASLLLKTVDVLRVGIPLAVAGAEELPPAAGAVMRALAAHARGEAEAADDVPADIEIDAHGDVDDESSAPAPERAPEELAPRLVEGRTLRVDVERLDRMLRLAGEVAN